MLHSLSPITARPIRIALVGCGRISKNHIRAICLHHAQAELVALCDNLSSSMDEAERLIRELAAKDSKAPQPLKRYTSYAAFLAAAYSSEINVDLVVLTTPSGLHSQQVIEAAKAGMHVCTEKPMATRWNDGIAMVNACDRAGVQLFVVKQNRFNSTLQLVKKQIQAGRFGRIVMVTVNVFWQRPQSYYDTSKWRGTWEYDGGALMNQASHYVDLLDWLVGPVESISASTATLGRSIEVEDTAALQLRWRSGALGTMAVTMLTFPKNLEGSITLLGETGTVRIGGPAVNKIDHWEFADKTKDDEEVENASYNTTSVYGFGHPPFYSNMLNALQGKSEAMCDGREGLRSLEILIGAYRSARDGQTVHLPLEF